METQLAWIPLASGQECLIDVVRAGTAQNLTKYSAVSQPQTFTLVSATRPRFGVVSVALLKLALRLLSAPNS